MLEDILFSLAFLVRDMAFEVTCRREFSQLVTNHIFSDINGNKLFPTMFNKKGSSQLH